MKTGVIRDRTERYKKKDTDRHRRLCGGVKGLRRRVDLVRKKKKGENGHFRSANAPMKIDEETMSKKTQKLKKDDEKSALHICFLPLTAFRTVLILILIPSKTYITFITFQRVLGTHSHSVR